MRCTFKISIVGVGNVGATTAFALLLDGTVTELVLVAHDVHKAEGEKLDLEQSLPFLQHTDVTVTDDYNQVAGSELTIITAGAAQKPGEDRLSLLQRNLAIFSDIIPKVQHANPEGLILIVTNPVDILTYHAYQVAQFRPGQVFGSGTVLDTGRFRFQLSELLNVNPRSIHAYILGEHGDTSFPLLSAANIGGQLISTFPEYTSEKGQAAFQQAKTAAYQIIERKGATYYAIATVIMQLAKTIYSNAQTVLPVSVPLSNYKGQSGVSLSVPCIVGQRGVEKVLDIPFSEPELQLFNQSAETLKQKYQEVINHSAPVQ